MTILITIFHLMKTEILFINWRLYMEKHLKEDFDYWIGMSGVGGEAVNRQELKPF